MLTLDHLRQEVESGHIDTVLACLVDMQGRLLGNRLHCGFPISFAWLDVFTPVLGLELEWPEAVLDYRHKIEAHDAVHTVLDDYAPHIAQWVESKK